MHDQIMERGQDTQDLIPIVSFQAMQPKLRLQLPKLLNYSLTQVLLWHLLAENARANAFIRKAQ